MASRAAGERRGPGALGRVAPGWDSRAGGRRPRGEVQPGRGLGCVANRAARPRALGPGVVVVMVVVMVVVVMVFMPLGRPREALAQQRGRQLLLSAAGGPRHGLQRRWPSRALCRHRRWP